METAAELRERLKLAEVAEFRQKEEKEKIFRETRPKPIYKYITKVGILGKDWCVRQELEQSETIRFTRTVENAAEIEALAKSLGVSCSDWVKPVQSIVYYLFHNVLMHHNGGNIIFKEPAYVTDEEWEGMKQGIIPAHLMNTFNLLL